MKIRIMAILAILAVARIAAADFEIVTLVKATELSPSNMILPGTANGMMTYRPCAGECDENYKRARLTEATRFSIAGKQVKYADFLRTFSEIKNGANSYALISVDTTTKTVTGINIKG
jgi:hypothetical protein